MVFSFRIRGTGGDCETSIIYEPTNAGWRFAVVGAGQAAAIVDVTYAICTHAGACQVALWAIKWTRAV